MLKIFPVQINLMVCLRFLLKFITTVCFKLKETSLIVSLLFLLNGHLLNLWKKSDLIVVAISLQKFQRKKEIA